ncbi:MAG TPA: phage holin family protein [Candidatus Portnoybacteria bacterium]|nr:phage holin family protein [Candidatus Portnoybacteria bacterium]
MMRFLVRILANAFAIYLAAYFVVDFDFPHQVQDWKLLLLAGLLLALFNAVLKPLLKLISAPLIVLSLGLFTLIINAALLWLLSLVIPELSITTFWAYFWGTLIISLVNWLVELFIKKKKTT